MRWSIQTINAIHNKRVWISIEQRCNKKKFQKNLLKHKKTNKINIYKVKAKNYIWFTRNWKRFKKYNRQNITKSINIKASKNINSIIEIQLIVHQNFEFMKRCYSHCKKRRNIQYQMILRKILKILDN